MSRVEISRLVCAALLALCLAPSAAQDKPAQDKVDLEDLKTRASAGNRIAIRRLADMYYAGTGGLDQNYGEAARLYQRLAKQGDRRAQTALGLMYARGYGVEKNYDVARRWWSYAAAQNDAGAQYNLGTLYYRGEGVAQDFAEAARWYRSASQMGHVTSQKNLAGMYLDGKGIAQDTQRAYYWFKVAALLGDDESQESVKIVGKRLNASQLREAESEADDWMRKYKKIVGD